jgi:hypothetical protein
MTSSLDDLLFPEWGAEDWGDFEMSQPRVSPGEEGESEETQDLSNSATTETEISDRSIEG